jgi:DNA-binding NarL/FixJ family response regulator
VDDHGPFRAFVRTLLDPDGFVVTGEAPDGETAITAIAELQPDVVLLDVQLPGIDGFEVARRLADLPVPPCVIMTSTRDASDYGTRLSQVPVRGFVSKQDLSAHALTEFLGEPCG